MTKKLNILLIAVLCLGFFFESCASSKVSSDISQPTTAKSSTNAAVSAKSNEIDVWTSSPEWEKLIKEFEAQNKGIKVNLKVFDYNSSNKEFIKALSSGTGPDVMEIYNVYFGQYVVNGILEDLLKDPYNAGKYEKDFPKDVWESNMSLDNKSILGITLNASPMLTFYRADVMKENGFPSEPEELGKFIESPENLVAIAKKLKTKDQYILQWVSEIADLIGSSMGFFDKDLNYVRNNSLAANSLVAKGVSFYRSAHKDALESSISYWSDDGRKAIQSSKLVMLHSMGPWVADELKSIAPDQKGKWRVTRPAFGVSGWASDSRMCINAQSKNKELAWKFIEFATIRKRSSGYTVPAYIPARKNAQDMAQKNEYLGGQYLHAICEEQVSNMKQYKLTPLDDKAWDLYRKQTYDAKYNSMEPSKAAAEMAKDVESAIAEERQVLFKHIKN